MLKKSDEALSREKIKKLLGKKIMHQTLNLILEYLEESGKILDGRKGIFWIYAPRKEIELLKKQGTPFEEIEPNFRKYSE